MKDLSSLRLSDLWREVKITGIFSSIFTVQENTAFWGNELITYLFKKFLSVLTHIIFILSFIVLH